MKNITITDETVNLAKNKSEKRRDLRSSIDMDVKCSHKSKSFSASSRNISKGGMFLETKESIAVGTPVELEFTLPHTTLPMNLNGTVVWSKSDKSGVGVKFNWRYQS